MLEPVARNTAPAVAVAALLVARDDPDAILVVMPSDHVIKDEAAFVAAVRRAAEVAATGRLVLFGVTPTTPHTGYGYIRRGDPLRGFADVFAVDAFMEKPTSATAAAYLNAGGHYLEQRHLRVSRARTFLDELGALAALHPGGRRAARSREPRRTWASFGSTATLSRGRPSISIDYAVMERTRAAAVVPVDIGWSDVGSWSSLWEIAKQDAAGNVMRGEGDPGVAHATATCTPSGRWSPPSA